MDLNDRAISDIARQLGLKGNKNISRRDLEHLSSKSDVELERELMKIKEQLKANDISYEQQMALVRSIAPMLDNKQRQRLDKVIDILRK